MVLNILGVFEAEEICSNNTIDKRTSEWKLISSLNEEGLYRDGLTSLKIKEKLFTNYKRHVDVNILNKNSSEDIIEATKIQIEENIPVIINLEFNKHDDHWVVAVGYILDGKGNLSDFLILDPGSNSPTYALWNGILDLHKEPRKVYGYKYNSDYNTYVDIPEIIIISKKDK